MTSHVAYGAIHAPEELHSSKSGHPSSILEEGIEDLRSHSQKRQSAIFYSLSHIIAAYQQEPDALVQKEKMYVVL